VQQGGEGREGLLDPSTTAAKERLGPLRPHLKGGPGGKEGGNRLRLSSQKRKVSFKG